MLLLNNIKKPRKYNLFYLYGRSRKKRVIGLYLPILITTIARQRVIFGENTRVSHQMSNKRLRLLNLIMQI